MCQVEDQQAVSRLRQVEDPAVSRLRQVEDPAVSRLRQVEDPAVSRLPSPRPNTRSTVQINGTNGAVEQPPIQVENKAFVLIKVNLFLNIIYFYHTTTINEIWYFYLSWINNILQRQNKEVKEKSFFLQENVKK